MDPKPTPIAPEKTADLATSVKTPRVLGGRLKLVGLAGGLFVLGVFISRFLHHGPAESDPPENHAVKKHADLPVHEPAEKKPSPPSRDKPGVAQGDEFFRDGRFAQALTVYQDIIEGTKGPAPGRLQLRRALCQESLGNWDLALADYQRIASHGAAEQTWLGQLGQARVYLRRGQPDEASLILSQLLLRNQSLDQASTTNADLLYLTALAKACGAMPGQAVSPLHDHVVISDVHDGALPPSLDWLTSVRLTAASAPQEKEEITLQPADDKAEQIVIKAMSPTVEVRELIDRLARAGQRETSWSPEAEKAVAHRTALVAAAHQPLLQVVRSLAEPLGLVCHVEKDVFTIETLAEKSLEWRGSYRCSEARRALVEATKRCPEHALVSAAYIALGNLEATANHPIEALGWYLRIARETPRCGLVLPAFYNVGILCLQLGNHEEAAKAFFRVLDHAPGHELAPQAYLRLGRMALEEGNAKQATSYFKRAAAKSAEGRTRAVAGLHVASAHLLSNDPQAARAALTTYREWLQTPPFRAPAQFLGAYAGFLADKSRSPSSREANDLLATLLQGGDEKVLGRTGKLLAGLAYRDLGMWDLAAQTYQKSLPDVKGPLAEELSFHLAEALTKTQKHDEAIALLTSLVKAKSSWSPRAQFQLAHLAFQANHAQECLDRCKKLLYEPTPLDQSAILSLMGQAYERLGNFGQAARCYAGQLPEG